MATQSADDDRTGFGTETAHEVPVRVTSERKRRIAAALDIVAAAPLDDREDAWR